VPAFGTAWADGASATGAITPTNAAADAARSALNLIWCLPLLFGRFRVEPASRGIK
jgi:hypothetical protein